MNRSEVPLSEYADWLEKQLVKTRGERDCWRECAEQISTEMSHAAGAARRCISTTEDETQ